MLTNFVDRTYHLPLLPLQESGVWLPDAELIWIGAKVVQHVKGKELVVKTTKGHQVRVGAVRLRISLHVHHSISRVSRFPHRCFDKPSSKMGFSVSRVRGPLQLSSSHHTRIPSFYVRSGITFALVHLNGPLVPGFLLHWFPALRLARSLSIAPVGFLTHPPHSKP
jgi:hypothetical protein